MQTDIELHFSIGHFNQESMSLEIKSSDQHISSIPQFTSSTYILEISVQLPVNLSILVTGRRTQDIKIDQHGKIEEEKYIHLQGMKIYHTMIESYKMPNSILSFYDTQSQIVKPNFFWNQNGIAYIKIDHADPLIWLINHHELW